MLPVFLPSRGTPWPNCTKRAKLAGLPGPCGHMLFPTCGCKPDAVPASAPALVEPLLGQSLEIHPDVVARRAARAREKCLLTQAEVDALPDDAIVELIWSGGNGPHRYEIRHRDGKSYALVIEGNPYYESEQKDWAEGRVSTDAHIKHVGGDQREDWVRLPTDSPWPHRPLTWRSDGRVSCPACGGGECIANAQPPLTPAGETFVKNLLPPLESPPVAAAPPEETHAGPAPKKERKKPRRNAASPWSPNYRDADGNYPNRRAPEPTAEEQVLAAIEAANASGDTAAIEALLKQLDTELARAHFATFCRAAWPVVEQTTKLSWNWHHELLANVLQGLFESWFEAVNSDGKLVTPIKNCVINCPPGSLKSKLIAVFFPVWVWLRAPGTKLICLSVNEAAAQRDARDSRDLIRSDWFQESFAPTWQLKGDQDAISNFGNTSGGVRLSKPSGSVIVGLRGDFLIGDDLNDPEDVEVDNEREKINSLWDTAQYNRTNDPLRSVRITVQQRLHARDHTGHIIAKQGLWSPDNPEGWLHVVLSAELDERRFTMPEVLARLLREKLGNDIILEDPRTEPGQTIDAVRMPPSYLEAERFRFKGTGSYAGQLLQRPALVEGARIKRNYWGWFRLEKGVRPDIDDLDTGRPRPAHCLDTKPTVIKAKHHAPGEWDFDWVVISLDPALKETKRGSCWGLLVIAGKGGRRYVLDDRTRRGDILEIIAVIRELILLWKPDKILVEDKAAGDEMRRRLIAAMSEGNMPMITLEVIKIGMAGKEERLDACLPAIANSMVSLLDGAPWLEEFVDECALFPVGQYEDRVDSLSQCMNFIRDYEADDWPDL